MNDEARTTQRLMPYSLVKALWQSEDKIRVVCVIRAKIKNNILNFRKWGS